MSKSVIAEESLKQHLMELAPSEGYVVGLVLGQRTAQRDFVIHLPVFQNTKPKNEDAAAGDTSFISEVLTFTAIQDINVKGFTLYAKQVSAFLPGGMWILGLFSSGPSDGILDQTQAAKLQNLTTTLFSKLSLNTYLSASSTPTPEKLIMNFNSSNNKLTCKSVNVSESKWHLSNMDWKFQPQNLKWIEIESDFAFDFKMPLKTNNGLTIKSNFEELLKIQASNIKEAHCFIENEVHDDNSILDSIETDDDDTTLTSELHIVCSGDPDANVEQLNSSGDFIMNGHVYSRVFMHPKATIGEAVAAIKEDIIRSLHTRFELHTDALIEEEEGSPEERVVQHDLPRRIFIPLPCSEVKLSNYLFPGETAKDSLASVQQVLGIQVDEDYIEEGMEQESEPDLPILSDDLSCPQTPEPEPEQGFMSLYTALAICVVVLALCTTLFLIKNEDENLNDPRPIKA